MRPDTVFLRAKRLCGVGLVWPDVDLVWFGTRQVWCGVVWANDIMWFGASLMWFVLGPDG